MATYGQENQEQVNKPSLILGGSVSFVSKKIKVGEGNLQQGCVLGEGADGKLRACKSASTDGSQIPLYIVFQEQGVNGGDVAEVLSTGMVRADLLKFETAGDNFNTVVEKLSIGNWLRQKFILEKIENFEYLPEKN